MRAVERWKQRVGQLKADTYAIYLASKDPRVPWYVKALIITPLGIAIVIKLIPENVLAECREEAQKIIGQDQPTNWRSAAVIIMIWLLVLAFVVTIIAQLALR